MAWITIDVDLNEFSDEELLEEIRLRGLEDKDDVALLRAHTLHHMGRRDEAYALLWEHCLEQTNRVI